MAALLILLITIGVIFLSSVLNGWALSILWSWFVVPVFGLPLLSIPTAIGVSLVVGYLTHQYADTPEGKKGQESNYSKIAYAFLKPVFALLVGWVVKQFLG